MSTRCAIIERVGNNYYGVYCHNEGYLSGVGKTLYKDYQDSAKVHELINLGSLATVGDDLDFSSGTYAYSRDKGDEYSKPYRGKTIPNVAKKINHNGYVYYVHVYENGIWMVWVTEDSEVPAGYYPLNEVVELDIPKDKPKEEYNCIHCGEPIYPTWYGSYKGLVPDWKHKGNKEIGTMWCCYGGYATAPANAVWAEPKIKKDGAE